MPVGQVDHDQRGLLHRIRDTPGYGDITAFRLGLQERNIGYVVAVKGSTSAYTAHAAPVTAAYTGRGRPPVPTYPDPPSSCKDIILAAGRATGRELTWRKGTKTSPGNKSAAMRSRFLAVRIRPANQDIDRADDGPLPQQWLIAEVFQQGVEGQGCPSAFGLLRRIQVRNTWAAVARVAWWCQPVQLRPSKWSSPTPVLSSR